MQANIKIVEIRRVKEIGIRYPCIKEKEHITETPAGIKNRAICLSKKSLTCLISSR